MIVDRRTVLTSTLAAGGLIACGRSESGKGEGKDEDEDEEVTPAEDLMREHGVLRRVMYVYDEAIAKLRAGGDVPMDALADGARMIRRVIEDYHEKMEEQLVFPRFERAGKLVDLVTVLRAQHASGRVVTDQILALVQRGSKDGLADALGRFNHMYRAHAAREDTVLFPAMRGLLGASAYHELGEQMEAKETEMIGEGGFERAVADVAVIEQAFGVGDLAKLSGG